MHLYLLKNMFTANKIASKTNEDLHKYIKVKVSTDFIHNDFEHNVLKTTIIIIKINDNYFVDIELLFLLNFGNCSYLKVLICRYIHSIIFYLTILVMNI